MTGSQDGSVSYEQSGEMFFLAYAVEDVEGGQRLQAGDQVEFFISTDERFVSKTKTEALCDRKELNLFKSFCKLRQLLCFLCCAGMRTL